MKVEILGQSFTLQSNEDEEYLKKIIAYIELKLSEIRSSAGTSDPTKLAIIASMLITDELFKQKNQSQEESQKVEEITRGLIDRLIQVVD